MSQPWGTLSAIVVAGGSGTRFGGGRPKQLALLAGRPVLTRTLAVFEASPLVAEIVLALPADWRTVIEDEAVRPFGFRKVKSVTGGATRTESARQGLAAAGGDLILVHDGVRPLAPAELIEAVARAAAEHGAALAALPVRDTVKTVSEGGLVKGTLDRGRLWLAQTPQGFRREVLEEALNAAGEAEATDDAGLAERLGRTVKVVPGSPRNLKITTPEDLRMAEALLAARAEGPGPIAGEPWSSCAAWSSENSPGGRLARQLIRIGHGYDLHRLVPGRPLFLGGVEIPFELGLLGHSDADVLAHALVDALLGAAGLGDIGGLFPDRDPAWAGAAGARLLAETMKAVRAAGYELVNADLTLVGEKPKIGPYREAMREATARALNVPPESINIKATTTEGLEATGEGRALAAHAVAALRPGGG